MEIVFGRKTKSKPLLIEGVNYEFVDIPDSHQTGIKILDGIYEGVVLFYGHVNVIQEDGKHILSFDYGIYSYPSYIDLPLHLTTQEFKNHVGDILTAILLSDGGEYATIRDHDSKESDS